MNSNHIYCNKLSISYDLQPRRIFESDSSYIPYSDLSKNDHSELSDHEFMDQNTNNSMMSSFFTESYTNNTENNDKIDDPSPEIDFTKSCSNGFIADKQYMPIEQSVGLLDTSDKEDITDIFSYMDIDPKAAQFIINQYERLHLDYEATIRAGHNSFSDSSSSENEIDTSDDTHGSTFRLKNTAGLHQNESSLPEFDNINITPLAEDVHINSELGYQSNQDSEQFMVNPIDENSYYVELDGEFFDYPDITKRALEFQRANLDEGMANNQSQSNEYKNEETFDTGNSRTNSLLDANNSHNDQSSPWDEADYIDFSEIQFTSVSNLNQDFAADDHVWGDYRIDEATIWDAEFKDRHSPNSYGDKPSANSPETMGHETSAQNTQNTGISEPLNISSPAIIDNAINRIYLSEEDKNIIMTTMASIQMDVPPSFRKFYSKTF